MRFTLAVALALLASAVAASPVLAQGEIVGWGANQAGQLNIPEPNENFVAVAAYSFEVWPSQPPDTESFAVGLRSDGTVVGWGGSGPPWYPPYDDIIAITPFIFLREDGSLVSYYLPPGPNADFIAIAGVRGRAPYHALAIREGGEIVAWGSNESGQCNVPEPNTGYRAIAAACTNTLYAIGYSLAIDADGSIVGWGNNGSGQLDVPEPNTDFVAVAAAPTHALGLKQDGSIVAWGWRPPPPLAGRFTAIAATTENSGGGPWSLALREDGVVFECLYTSEWYALEEDNWTAVALAPRNRYAIRGHPVAAAIALSPLPAAHVVSAVPNPFSFRTVITAPDAARDLVVYDSTGRLVRALGQRMEWDGLDAHGLSVPAGVYFLRLDSPQGPRSFRVVRLH